MGDRLADADADADADGRARDEGLICRRDHARLIEEIGAAR